MRSEKKNSCAMLISPFAKRAQENILAVHENEKTQNIKQEHPVLYMSDSQM